MNNKIHDKTHKNDTGCIAQIDLSHQLASMCTHGSFAHAIVSAKGTSIRSEVFSGMELAA